MALSFSFLGTNDVAASPAPRMCLLLCCIDRTRPKKRLKAVSDMLEDIYAGDLHSVQTRMRDLQGEKFSCKGSREAQRAAKIL